MEITTMRTITTTVYTYDELSDRAKERAREWYRNGMEFDHDTVIDDAVETAALFGLDLRQRMKRAQDGSTLWTASVYFSGFWSQGDGASFDGEYRHKKGAVQAVLKHAPNDAELHRIVRALGELQRKCRYSLCATLKASHRCHTTRVEAINSERGYPSLDDAAELQQLMNDYAAWVYTGLREEYEYQTSDECVEQALIDCEYEFDENGEHV